MITPTGEQRDNMIKEYLRLARDINSAKGRQDDIKLTLQADMVRREVEEILSYRGTVKRIAVAKSVSFPGSRVLDLAKVWDDNPDPLLQQCGRLLMNLANIRPARHYLRITAPK